MTAPVRPVPYDADVDCRRCGSALTPGARFCASCGTAVSTACASCGAELPDAARFCPACGAAVDVAAQDAPSGVHTVAFTSPRDPGRERKRVTLLFADIVDFTGLTEAQDPELVSGLVGDTFERLSREVRRYEGTIEKFAGDAMLAVFGVPAAHEDDPERAVRAALEMQSVAAAMEAESGAGQAVRLRIGLETGEVLVDRARAAAERDLFVTGDAVNTASRLQSAAQPGTVVVGASAYAATRDVIDYDELDCVEAKGKACALAAWRAVSVKAGRGGRSARLGLESPLVGRDTEMALLKETARRIVDDGRPNLVTVIGSAGVGKSRLAWELEKYLDGLPDDYHWRKGRCPAYSGRSFGPVADVVKVDAHIRDDDAPAVARAKLASRLDELRLGPDEKSIRDALEAVLAIGEPRERARDELFEAWRRYIGAIATTAPLVLVIEDLHWADEGVLAFLDFLARWGEGPILILGLARHELIEQHATWGGGLGNASTIMLEPLGPAASSALMAGLLDGGVPRQLGRRIIELAEGNPLFAEEMVRMLVDRGTLRFTDGRWQLARPVDEVRIPRSVQAVLAARLDTLPENEKRVAQDAAVVGRVFWDQLVAHISRDDLAATSDRIRRLRVKDLVVPREPSALAGASEYGFRHVLIRDVAYDSLPKRDRAALHRDIAEWAERELADRVEEFGELIASHYAAAVAYEEEFDTADGPELQELRRLTHVAALRAGRRAWVMSQASEAERWQRLAIELGWKVGLPAREIASLALEYSDVSFMVGDASQQSAIAMRALEGLLALPDRGSDDELLIARLRRVLGHGLFYEGDVEAARQVLRNALVALGDGPPSGVRAQLKATLGWTYWRSGPTEESLPLLEDAVAEAEAAGDAAVLRWAKHELGAAHGALGNHDQAVAAVTESMQLAQQAGDHNLILRCYINLPATRAARGDDIRPLLEMAIEGISMARRAAAGSVVCWLAGNIAGFMRELGRLDEALEYQSEAVIAAEAHVIGNLATALADRASLHRLRDEADAALQDEARLDAIDGPSDAMTAAHRFLSRAARDWQADPEGALHRLTTASTAESCADEHGKIAFEVARMALRLGDGRRLEQATSLRRSVVTGSGPTAAAASEWIESLSDGSAGVSTERAAGRLEELGLIVAAAEAWADAAVLAARAGRPSDALDRALGLCERVGMVMHLGPLPETRWLHPTAATPVPKGVASA